MKVSIYTHAPSEPEATLLQNAARAAGATVQAGPFDDQDRQALYTSDIAVLRVSPRRLLKSIALAEACAAQAPKLLLSVSAEGIRSAYDKYAAYQLLSAHNVPTPQTYLLQQLSDCETFALPTMLPLIVKPRSENRGI